MKFRPVPVREAEGALLVHSVRLPEGSIRKGTHLGPDAIARLAGAGLHDIVVAIFEPGDVPENEAARRLAEAVAREGVRVDRAFTGRSNLFAEHEGLLVVDRDAIGRVNAVDEAITVATLPAYKPVAAGEMIGTVKIIPFAVPGRLLEASVAATAGRRLIRVAAWRPLLVGVVSTVLPGLKPSVIRKTVDVLARRISLAGARIGPQATVPHDASPLARELREMAAGPSELLVVFGASAITDRRDVIPAAIEQAGGVVEHFGMPVDPGNLLLLGRIAGKPVLGAPGCARSPKENGFDWILQRLLAGVPVARDDIMGLGVGGLLMEIVQRGQPREARNVDDGESDA
jgi:molybdenum cofactor cytidylyltransferase